MTNDVQKAAERLRRTRLYGGDCEWTSVYLIGDDRCIADERHIVWAYLAEHDDTPIDGDWWRVVADDGTDLCHLHFGHNMEFWLDLTTDNVVVMDSPLDSTRLPHIKTRGQLRALCSALNIALNEPSDREDGK